MLRTISLGTYYEGTSLLHRLQARTKLLLLVGIACWYFFASQHFWNFTPILAAVTIVIASVGLSCISPRIIWQRLWLLVVFMLFGGIPTLFTREGTFRSLYALGPLITTYGTMRQILLIGAAVFLFILFTTLLPMPILRFFWRNRWFSQIRIPLLLLTLIAFFYLWLIHLPKPTTPYPIGPLTITYTGVWTIGNSFVFLLVLFTSSLLVTMTTSPVALIEGLTILLTPLRRLKLPVDDFALMALIALRFIPTLQEEIELLIKAQTARGADLSSGTLIERLQSLSMLFIPLIQSILRRAAELGTALEARGYRSEEKQTLLYEGAFTRKDFVVLGLLALIIIGTLLV